MKLNVKYDFNTVLLMMGVILFSVNLGGWTSGIIIYCTLCLVFYSIVKHKSTVPKCGVQLLLTMVSVVLLSHGYYYSYATFIRVLLGPVVFFFIGYYIVYDNFDNARNTIFILAYIIAFGFVIQQFLTLIVNIDAVKLHRYTNDFWTKEVLQPTNFNSRGIIFCSFVYPLLKRSKGIFIKVAIVAGTVIVIVSAVLTASRTNLYFLPISFAIGILYDYFYLRTESFSETFFGTKKKIFATFVVICLCVFLICIYWGKIQAWYASSALAERKSKLGDSLTIVNDGRWYFAYNVLVMLLGKPMGDPNTFYAHNLFLDIGRVSGVIPMVLMIVFFISLLRNWKKTISKYCRIDASIKILFFTGLLIMFFAFQLEPVIEGRPTVFIAFCLFAGMIFAVKHQEAIEVTTDE